MKLAIFWFRRDLRLADNPALSAALAQAEGAKSYPPPMLDLKRSREETLAALRSLGRDGG